VECTAAFQGDGVHSAAFVRQLDPLTFAEGAAATGSSHRLRAAGGNTGLRCSLGVVDGSFAAHDSSSLL
jgi:hypothetical protein